MIVVYRVSKSGEMENVLAYDAENEQLWGEPRLWESHLDKVGLTEKEFAAFFDGPNYVAGKYEGDDPFTDVPNAGDELRNYPPGSEEIPDVPTVEPLDRDYEREYGHWD